MEPKFFSEVKNTWKTGDIILFCGNGWFSSIIQCFTRTEYSHIGMIIRGKSIPGIISKIDEDYKDPDDLYLFHSNKGPISDIPDIISGLIKDGVQLNSLNDILECYNGSYYYRSLIRPEKTRQINTERLELIIDQNKKKSYENDYIEMMKASVDGCGCCCQNSRAPAYLFCSELVALIYKKLGIVSSTTIENEYIPNDFSIVSQSDIVFINGWELGIEYQIFYQ